MDDSWFWPSNWSLTLADTATQAVIPESLAGEIIPVGNTAFTTVIRPAARQAGGPTRDFSEVEDRSSSLSILRESLTKKNTDDAMTAIKLIRFIQKRFDAGMNYGLCLCSFEYFWMNVESIDLPHNAVFFDLSHTLAESGTPGLGNGELGLKSTWKTLLEGCGLFTTENDNYDMKRLGWYLHYALKFGRAGSRDRSGLPRCQSRISFDHILIISSAIAGDAVKGRDAIGEYLQIQNAIWTTLGENSKGVRPGHFTFAPLPKVFTDERFTTALNIFSNSFSHAASWEEKVTMLKEDMLWLWKKREWGHLRGTDNRENLLRHLKWSDWIAPVENDDFCKDLCGLYHLDERDCLSITGATLCDFFRYSIPRCEAVVNGRWNIRYFVPCRPGIAVLIGMVLFFDQLSKKKEQRYVDPTLTATCLANCFKATITVNAECVRELKKVYDTGCAGGHGSSLALLNLNNSGEDVIAGILEPAEREQVFHGECVSTRLKSQNKAKMLVGFEGEAFTFTFPKFNA